MELVAVLHALDMFVLCQVFFWLELTGEMVLRNVDELSEPEPQQSNDTSVIEQEQFVSSGTCNRFGNTMV